MWQGGLRCQSYENADKRMKMADLQFVDFAFMPLLVRREKQFKLPGPGCLKAD